MAGQIETGHNLGDTLDRLARQEHVREVLEIGTYTGEGSTHVLARALAATQGRLYSVESRLDHYELASDFYQGKGLPVELLYGLSLAREEFPPFEHYLPLITQSRHAVEHPGDYIKWYSEEFDHAHRSDTDRVLERLVARVGGFDLVLLDGGEFLSDLEFEFLEPHIRHYVVMDDTNGELCIKNARSRERILHSPDWEVLVDAQHERNGWLAAQRRTATFSRQ